MAPFSLLLGTLLASMILFAGGLLIGLVLLTGARAALERRPRAIAARALRRRLERSGFKGRARWSARTWLAVLAAAIGAGR
jgi:hypothetical protein